MKQLLLLLIPSMLWAMQPHERALFSAASLGNLQRVAWLFSNNIFKNPMNKSKESALHKAIAHDHNHIARYLLDNKKLDPNEPDRRGITPAHIAASRDNTSLVDYLIRTKKVDVRKKFRHGTLAQIAKRSRARNVLKVLIKHVGKESQDPLATEKNKKGGYCPICLDHVSQKLYNVSNYTCMHFICGSCKKTIQNIALCEGKIPRCPLCREHIES